MNPPAPLTRRTFVRRIGAGAALTLASVPFSAKAAAPSARAGNPARARNVLFFVSDGMTHGTLSLANHYIRLTRNRQSHWMQLYVDNKVVRALMETNSADSIVTDSAAASCAWACGRRINNNAVNILPDGRPIDPILRYTRRAGKSTGLVTTTRITHATPAGWVAQVAHREQEDDIAVQELEQRVDILLGGGTEHFDPARRADGRNLWAEFTAAGYRVIRNRSEWRAPDGPVLGCFHESHLPYTVDQNNDPQLRATVPTLAEMTGWALDGLSRNEKGFVLQVEGGRVDHAAHANDAAGAMWDQIAFDDALGVGIEFARRNPDTLVIVTTDHGTGGLDLNGLGPRYSDSKPGMLSLGRVTSSFERINTGLRDGTPAERRRLIRERLAADLTAGELDEVNQAFDQVAGGAWSMRDAEVALGRVLSNHNAVGFTTRNHTGDLVELCAFGPGSERIPMFVENHALFNVMTDALALRV